MNSLFTTIFPHSLKKSSTVKGHAIIGFQGNRYLFCENGEKKATPIPPAVIASNIP